MIRTKEGPAARGGAAGPDDCSLLDAENPPEIAPLQSKNPEKFASVFSKIGLIVEAKAGPLDNKPRGAP
jgi:hypothetical protein